MVLFVYKFFKYKKHNFLEIKILLIIKMLKKIILVTLILLFVFLYNKTHIENFRNLIDPRYHTIALRNDRDLYTRFLDYFHYGNISKYDYPYVLPTVPLNIYNYPMNYIKSPYRTINKSPYRTLYGRHYATPDYLAPYTVSTTIYDIENIKNPNDYSYQILDKYGNLHLLDYKSDAKILTNENFDEQVWMNPHDKKIIFIPKDNYVI